MAVRASWGRRSALAQNRVTNDVFFILVSQVNVKYITWLRRDSDAGKLSRGVCGYLLKESTSHLHSIAEALADSTLSATRPRTPNISRLTAIHAPMPHSVSGNKELRHPIAEVKKQRAPTVQRKQLRDEKQLSGRVCSCWHVMRTKLGTTSPIQKVHATCSQVLCIFNQEQPVLFKIDQRVCVLIYVPLSSPVVTPSKS